MNTYTRKDCNTCGTNCSKKRFEKQRIDVKCASFTESENLKPMKISIIERLVKSNPVAAAETLRRSGLKLFDHHQYPFFRLEPVRNR